MMTRAFRFSVIAVLTSASICCSVTKAPKLAESGVAGFHSQYNSGNFHEIYVQADEGFQKSGKEEDFQAYLEAMRRKLGTVKEATRAATNINTTPSGTFVTVNYNVNFSEGQGSEQFVFRISGDKALLYAYNVNSPLLITR
jgi:hypothetical protein